MYVFHRLLPTPQETGIDEGLYSRQVYVLGVEAMKQMARSNVLIVGLTGLGCEIAKNLILAGKLALACRASPRAKRVYFMTNASCMLCRCTACPRDAHFTYPGVASVTLHDTETLTFKDLSSHFYVSEQHVGQNRVKACIDKLCQLNTYVAVREHSGQLVQADLKAYQVCHSRTSLLLTDAFW